MLRLDPCRYQDLETSNHQSQGIGIGAGDDNVPWSPQDPEMAEEKDSGGGPGQRESLEPTRIHELDKSTCGRAIRENQTKAVGHISFPVVPMI
jgi:hypothetical protein